MNSFCAWYSLRMSFCSVPPSAAREMPRFSACATNIAKMTAAGELIVKGAGAAILSRQSLARALATPSWQDPATGDPKL